MTEEQSQKTLIGFLHDLGIVLNFRDDPRLPLLLRRTDGSKEAKDKGVETRPVGDKRRRES